MTIEHLQKAGDLAFKIQQIEMFLNERKEYSFNRLTEIDWMRISKCLEAETQKRILQFVLDEIIREVEQNRDEFEKL